MSSKKAAGGSSHDRRNNRRHENEGEQNFVDTPKSSKASSGTRGADASQRLNELFAFLGLAVGCASWSWSVIAPESSVWGGSILLFAAVALMLWGVWRALVFQETLFWLLAATVIVGSIAFDWRIVVKPQRDKPFQALLVEGYHLTNECESIPGDTQMPTWIRDQSKEWQSRTQQLVGDRLKPTDAQTWQKAIVIGKAEDEGTNAYQCLWLSNKVAALETIVATEFDPKLRHKDVIGPIYWLNAVNGQVDITDMAKSGRGQGSIFINGGGREKNPSGMITVTGHDLPVKNGIITFTPSPP